MTDAELRSRYDCGLSMSELGKLAGVSKQRIHQRLKALGLNLSYTHRKRLNQRFWSKVDKTDSCWLWTGFIDPSGYGKFTHGSHANYAHRYSLSLVEDLDRALVIDHLCRVRHCVNPNHLEQVTQRANVMRAPKHIVHGDFKVKKTLA